MNTQDIDSQPIPQLKPSTWLDLILYLAAGFGLFSLAAFGMALIFREFSVLTSLALYLLNVLFLTGTVYVLGVRRGKTTWSEIGFLPVVWRWEWLLVALGISVVFIPVRLLVGLAIQLLFEGGLESLQGRADILLAWGGFSWINFILTLLGAGLIAPISEELYFRGLIHRWFQSRLRFWPRVVLSSAIFGLAHSDSVAVIASSFVLGLVNAVAYERSKSLWLPIAMHMITNSIGVILLYLGMAIAQLPPSPP